MRKITDEKGVENWIKPTIKFEKGYQQENIPIVIYADLKSVLLRVYQGNLLQKHVPCASSIYSVGKTYKNNLKIDIGDNEEDLIEKFCKSYTEEGKKISDHLIEQVKKYKNLIMSEDNKKIFQASKSCRFCNKEFEKGEIKVRDHVVRDRKVRDHDHVSGKFRGAAHAQCNLKSKLSFKIPVLFHYGSNYDFKLIVKHLYEIDPDLKVSPKSEDTYFSMECKIPETKMSFIFKDTYRFTGTSLVKMANNLYDGDGEINNFKHLKAHFRDGGNNKINPQILNIIMRKGVFPYSFLDSFKKLSQKGFPMERVLR